MSLFCHNKNMHLQKCLTFGVHIKSVVFLFLFYDGGLERTVQTNSPVDCLSVRGFSLRKMSPTQMLFSDRCRHLSLQPTTMLRQLNMSCYRNDTQVVPYNRMYMICGMNHKIVYCKKNDSMVEYKRSKIKHARKV